MTPVQICPVPYNQRPSNEYLNLKVSFNVSWVFQSTEKFFYSIIKNIGLNYGVVYTIQSTIQTKNNQITLKIISELLLFTTILSLIYIIQSYLACLYVYNRLMLSSVTYEESGWYDGQTWIKSKETLLQDRLIGIYELHPKIERLKITLVALVIVLLESLIVYRLS